MSRYTCHKAVACLIFGLWSGKQNRTGQLSLNSLAFLRLWPASINNYYWYVSYHMVQMHGMRNSVIVNCLKSNIEMPLAHNLRWRNTSSFGEIPWRLESQSADTNVAMRPYPSHKEMHMCACESWSCKKLPVIKYTTVIHWQVWREEVLDI